MNWFKKLLSPARVAVEQPAEVEPEWVPGYDVTRYVGWTRQVLRSDPRNVCDLTGLVAVRVRVAGVSYWAGYDESPRPGGRSYLLVLEPENAFDPKAVAVYFGRRKVGHLSAKRAAVFTELFAGQPYDAYKIGGMLEKGKYPMLDLPSTPALRKFAASL